MIEESLSDAKKHFDVVMGIGTSGLLVLAGIGLVFLLNQTLLGIISIGAGLFMHGQ
jgi:hypothetical protein